MQLEQNMKNFYIYSVITVILSVLTFFTLKMGEMNGFKAFVLGFLSALILVSVLIAAMSFMKRDNPDEYKPIKNKLTLRGDGSNKGINDDEDEDDESEENFNDSEEIDGIRQTKLSKRQLQNLADMEKEMGV